MKSESVFGFDFALFISTTILLVVGVLFIFSSGVTSAGVVFSNEYVKQIVWATTGLAIFILVSMIDYPRVKGLAVYLYAAALGALILTLLVGRVVNGSRSWLGIGDLGIQPSEFMKIATIVYLAAYLERVGDKIRSFKYFAGAALIMAPPMFLIMLQPDLGTTLVYAPIFLVMVFVGGGALRHIVFLLSVAGLMIILTFVPVYAKYVSETSAPILNILTERRLIAYLLGALAGVAAIGAVGFVVSKRRYLYWLAYAGLVGLLAAGGSFLAHRVLMDYQMMRLVVFLNPGIDPKGAGWNIIQSVTAVGSGGLFGKGFLRGTQSQYRYLPQQSTDFIFSILAEEWGFIGCLVVFALFFVILYRGVTILSLAKDRFASCAAAGVVGMVFFHFLVNVGMTMGIMPVTGIPLFFLSYGGSSLWTVLISVGLLMSFFVRRYRY